MDCISCKNNETLEGRSLCRNCFLRSVGQRIRKELRSYPKENRTFLVHGDRSAASQTLISVLEELSNESRQSVKKVANIDKNVLVSVTLDELNASFIGEVLLGKKRIDLTGFFPLARVENEECEEYCRLKKLDFSKKEPDALRNFMRKLEKANPGTHYSLRSSREKLDEITK